MDFINGGSSQDIDERIRWNIVFGMSLNIKPEFTPLLAIWCIHLLNYK